jgi:hypothetical protein
MTPGRPQRSILHLQYTLHLTAQPLLERHSSNTWLKRRSPIQSSIMRVRLVFLYHHDLTLLMRPRTSRQASSATSTVDFICSQIIRCASPESSLSLSSPLLRMRITSPAIQSLQQRITSMVSDFQPTTLDVQEQILTT